MVLTWEAIRERIRRLGGPDRGAAVPLSAEQTKIALQCAVSLEAGGFPLPQYAFGVDDHFTFGWLANGHCIECRSDGSFHASFEEIKAASTE